MGAKLPAEFYQRVAGHRERLRKKFLTHGLKAFTDEEVLELLLIFGTPRRDCKIQARELLKRFGSLAQVLEAPLEELCKVSGVGPKNALALKFVHEVARRFLARRLAKRPYISCAQEVFEYLGHSMMDLKREVFKVLFLDARHHIITVEELFQGTVNESAVYPREILKRSLELQATALVLAHNHPSGDPSPSRADIDLTKRILMACRVLQIRLLDHLIIAKEGYFSFADNGLLNHLENQVQGVF